MDKARNLTLEEVESNNETGIIHFERPRGNYSTINITCYPTDASCSSRSFNVTNSTENCLDCTSIILQPFIRGIKYECSAETIKENFPTVPSGERSFKTSIAYISIFNY